MKKLSPSAAGLLTCLCVFVSAGRAEAQVGGSCTLGARGGVAAPVGDLAEFETAGWGWTGVIDGSCPLVGSLEAGAQLEQARLKNLRFRSLEATLGLPMKVGGTDSDLFVRPRIHAGVSFQSNVDLESSELAPGETLWEKSVFTAGAGLDAGLDFPGPVSVLVGTGWRTNFNTSSTCVPAGPDLPACGVVPGHGALHRFTFSGGLLLDLFSP